MRKTIIAIACCIVLLLLGYSGYRGYQVWKQNRLLGLAKLFATKVDYRNELLCLQQVLRVNPRNLEACRMMANLTEAARSPGALIWRGRVLELNPNSLDDRLALVQTAMLLKDAATATNTLAGVDEAGKGTPAYHNVAGVVAVTLGQSATAEKHFSEAARLEPGNLVPQVNLAIVRLHGTNTLDIAEARIDLKRIGMTSTNFTLRSQALRELVLDAARANDVANALALARELTTNTNAAFSDRLILLDLLREAKSPELDAAIVQCQNEAAADSTKLSDMATWLKARYTPATALAWLQRLPVQMQTNQPAMLLVAQCLLQAHDWGALQSALEKQNWGELEFARHAYLARSMRQQNLGGTSTAEWELALKYANSQKSMLVLLFRTAAEWNWVDEAEQILWSIVNRYPEERWAVPMLQQALVQGGRTRPLMQLLETQAKRLPGDLAINNDLAMTALLLDSRERRPFDLAREVYQKAPQNPACASTYAFSLYLQKSYPEALKVMQQLTPEQLSNPAVAGYYGLILNATGDSARARAYLGYAFKATLLPEERRLFEQALKK